MPTVALGPDGRFLVAWDRCDFSNPLLGCSVVARRYDAAGRPLSGEIRVSPEGVDTHLSPATAFNDRGDFAVTWKFCDSDVSGQPLDCRIATRLFRRTGTPLPALALIESDNKLFSPAVTGLADQFLVAFDSVDCDAASCGNSPNGAFGQRYALP